MLDKDKGNKINDGEDKLAALDDLIQDLNQNKNDALEKLALLKNAIQDAKRAGRSDPDLQDKIQQMEDEAKQIEREINDIDRKIDDIKKKKADFAKQLDSMRDQPDKFKPSAIETLLTSVDELLDKAEQNNDSLRNKIIPNEDDMLRQLDHLVGQSEEKQELLHKTGVLDKDIKDNLAKYKDVMDKLP